MKMLYSSWLGPSKKLVNRSSLEMAKVSNFLAQKAGYETIFIGDNKSIPIYKNIKYNHILEFPKIINDFPKCMWSAGKLLALSMIKEPVIHVDFDLLFLKPPNKNKINKEIICLHKEITFNDKWQELYDIYSEVAPQETLSIKPTSYNSAIIGGNNINIIHSCVNNLLELIIKNSEKIENLFKTETSKTLQCGWFHIPAVLLEQIWLYQLFTYHNKHISVYLEGNPIDYPKLKRDRDLLYDLNMNAMNEGVTHFQKMKVYPRSIYAIGQFCELFAL